MQVGFMYTSIVQNMNWSTILNKEIGKCTILNYTIITVFKNAMHYMCISFIASRYHLKQYDQLKWMWKALKNILIVNHDFVVTIGLPYCYFIPFKVILEQTISTKLCDLLHMFCWFECTKTKVTTTCTTSEV